MEFVGYLLQIGRRVAGNLSQLLSRKIAELDFPTSRSPGFPSINSSNLPIIFNYYSIIIINLLKKALKRDLGPLTARRSKASWEFTGPNRDLSLASLRSSSYFKLMK